MNMRTTLQWLAENAARAYPLRETSTQTDNAGKRLPENMLVDARLTAPQDGLYDSAYLSSLTVTPRLVTVTFSIYRQSAPAGSQAPLAVLHVERPVDPLRLYPVVPVYGGAGGWVAFGNGVNLAEGDWRFNGPAQSALLEEAFSLYQPAGVRSLGEIGLATVLRGQIMLRGAGDLQVTSGRRTIDGVARDCIIFSLRSGMSLDEMRPYIGPCLGRPEGKTCQRSPIYEIIGVRPDCTGNIELEIISRDNLPIQVAKIKPGGLALLPQFGLEVVCPDPLESDPFGDLPPRPPYTPPPPYPWSQMPTYSKLIDFSLGEPGELIQVGEITFPEELGDMVVVDCQWQLRAHSPVAPSLYKKICALYRFSSGLPYPSDYTDYIGRQVGLHVQFAQLPAWWDPQTDLSEPIRSDRTVAFMLTNGFGYGIRAVGKSGMVEIVRVAYVDEDTGYAISSTGMQTTFATGSILRVAFKPSPTSGGRITFQVVVVGAAPDGSPTSLSLSETFVASALPLDPVNNWLGVMVQAWEYGGCGSGECLETYPLVLDNFTIDYFDPLPAPLPCLETDDPYLAYSYPPGAGCSTCQRLQITLPDGGMCGIDAPPTVTTYERYHNVFNGFARHPTDPDITVNVTVIASPDGCTCEIYLLLSDGITAVFATGLGYWPGDGQEITTILEAQVPCVLLYAIKVGCM